MTASTRPPQVTVHREIEVKIFPGRYEEGGSRIVGGLAMFFGLSFSGLPALAMAIAFSREGFTEDLKSALLWWIPLFLLFAWMTVYGLDQWVRRTNIEIDSREVRWRYRRWCGRRERGEPLSRYVGISGERRVDSEEGNLWELVLIHRDRSCNILLYQADGPSGWAERWRRYCQALRRPALECLAPGEYAIRPLDGLDRPFVTLLRQGLVTVPEPGPLPAGVRVLEEKGTTRVCCAGQQDIVLTRGRIEMAGSGHRNGGLTVGFAEIETVTVEKAPLSFGGGVLVLQYLASLPDGSTLRLRKPLVDALPWSTLLWVQRLVLRAMAPPNRPGKGESPNLQVSSTGQPAP